jgi:signal transduction histidine kinase
LAGSATRISAGVASELGTRVTRLLDKQGAHTQTIQQRRRDAIREIVATIVHEINNRLTVALGNLDVVVEYEQISPLGCLCTWRLVATSYCGLPRWSRGCKPLTTGSSRT